jgi:hypothetical protein
LIDTRIRDDQLNSQLLSNGSIRIVLTASVTVVVTSNKFSRQIWNPQLLVTLPRIHVTILICNNTAKANFPLRHVQKNGAILSSVLAYYTSFSSVTHSWVTAQVCINLTLYTYKLEVPGSNLGSDTDYPDSIFWWCSSVPPGKCTGY